MQSEVLDQGRPVAKTVMRVLIVDDEVNVRFAIERALRKHGMETGSATSVRHAIDRLRNEPYDAVVCELKLPGGDGTHLLNWLGSYSPSTHIIILSGAITDDIRTTYGTSESIRILEKPVDVDVLRGVLEEWGPRRGFYGNSIEVELFDYVQMVALSGRDKLVEVQTPAGRGHIWFEHGDIVHCEYDQFRGELAFYKLLAVNRGTFKESHHRPPPLRTVTRSSTHLLMEAARQTDEGILGEVGPGGTREDLENKHVEEIEASFEDLNDLDITPDSEEEHAPLATVTPITAARGKTEKIPLGDVQTLDEPTHRFARGRGTPHHFDSESSMASGEDLAAMSTAAGHAIFDDPDTRTGMLDQFWQFEGINGVAIISSTGKVLAEDMRTNTSLVTLAGFYMRGAARIARTLGYNVFDGVVARSVSGQQMVMVSMGAASAVLSVEQGADPEAVRDAVMGVE
jgi:CheY-like chemotaxis protein